MSREQRRMNHFWMLDHEEQVKAVQRLAAAGMSDSTIATAAGVRVEMIRRILAEAREASTA